MEDQSKKAGAFQIVCFIYSDVPLCMQKYVFYFIAVDSSSFNHYYEHHSAGCIIAREMSLVSKPLALFLRLITEICHNFQSNKATCPDVSQFAIFSSLLLIFPPGPS